MSFNPDTQTTEVLFHDTKYYLQTQVQRYLNNGWHKIGGIAEYHNGSFIMYSQAMEKKPPFIYKEHKNLMNHTAEQIQEYLSCDWHEARGRLEQAVKLTNGSSMFDDYRECVTNKVSWEIVVEVALSPHRNENIRGANKLSIEDHNKLIELLQTEITEL